MTQDFILTVPKGQIRTFCGVVDISNSLRHSQAMKDLIDMKFDFVGMNEDSYIRKYKDTRWISLPILWNKVNREIYGELI